jgi:hypothetical protein
VVPGLGAIYAGEKQIPEQLGKDVSMKISLAGTPTVFLSSNLALVGTAEEAGSVAVNIPVKIEDKAEEDGPLLAQLQLRRGRPLEGKAMETRTSAVWLLYRIPRELCPEGGSLRFCALADEVVLWQKEYRVVWRGRFPALESAA